MGRGCNMVWSWLQGALGCLRVLPSRNQVLGAVPPLCIWGDTPQSRRWGRRGLGSMASREGKDLAGGGKQEAEAAAPARLSRRMCCQGPAARAACRSHLAVGGMQQPSAPGARIRPARHSRCGRDGSRRPDPVGGAAFARGSPLHPAAHMGEPRLTPPALMRGSRSQLGHPWVQGNSSSSPSLGHAGEPGPCCHLPALGSCSGCSCGTGTGTGTGEEGVWGLFCPFLHSQTRR